MEDSKKLGEAKNDYNFESVLRKRTRKMTDSQSPSSK